MQRRGDFYLDWVTNRVRRRTWPIVVSIVYVGLALAYFFGWGSVVQHIPGSWTLPYDTAYTYLAGIQLAHGHFGSIYTAHASFDEFPGIVIAMAPIGAFSSAFHTTLFEVIGNHSYVVNHYSVTYSYLPFLTPGWLIVGGKLLVAQPQWAVAVGFYSLLLSCTALFAFDALAEGLRVSKGRRVVLCFVEAVLLWNVIVVWGHPEDAVAVALAVYALIFCFRGRFVGAGWLFGAAVLFQPLVLLMLPVLLAMAGRRSGLGLAVRSLLPSAVLVAVPLAVNFSATFHALAEQPNYPNRDHATPWTALSPHLGGHGLDLAVAGGPGRVLAILLAVLIGIWVSKRCLKRPELVVLACAVALALRSYTESVMDPYYPWAALAVGVVVAARCSRWRFAIAISLGVAATVLAQWKLAWLPWWTIQIVLLTALLVVAAKQPAPALAKDTLPPRRTHSTGSVGTLILRVLGDRHYTPEPPPKKADPKTRRPKSAAVAQGRSGSETTNKAITKKKGGTPPAATKRSGRN